MPRKEPCERRICLSHCPVKECDTDIYRGSRCKELREKAGIHFDPDVFKDKKPKPIIFTSPANERKVCTVTVMGVSWQPLLIRMLSSAAFAPRLIRAISCMSGKHGKEHRMVTIIMKIGKEMILPILRSGNHPSTCQKKQHVSGYG